VSPVQPGGGHNFATKAVRPTRIALFKRAEKTDKDGYLPVGLTNLPKNNT